MRFNYLKFLIHYKTKLENQLENVEILRRKKPVIVKGGSRHKVHHYEERVILFIRNFSNCSTLHRNALAAWAGCLYPRSILQVNALICLFIYILRNTIHRSLTTTSSYLQFIIQIDKRLPICHRSLDVCKPLLSQPLLV